MNEDLLKVIGTKKFLDDQSTLTLSQIHQLAFGLPSAVATAVTIPTSSTAQAYTTGIVSQYYKENRKLFMYHDSLKIIAFNIDARCDDNSVYEFDDTSHISSSYAITEYFNVMYYDKLLIPGFKLKYEINDTKNVVKHLDFLTQKYENISQHTSSFPIGKIAHKWENLHKALI